MQMSNLREKAAQPNMQRTGLCPKEISAILNNLVMIKGVLGRRRRASDVTGYAPLAMTHGSHTEEVQIAKANKGLA